ncbi:MAG: peptide ABC transporter substrate-binding protein [Aliidongia sp.]
MVSIACRCAALAAILLPIVFGQAAAETELRRPTLAEPETLDPHKTTSADDFAIDTDLFEPLVGLDSDGRLAPGAAESWEVSEDGLVYTFHLRPDGHWSNGDPVTAADFVFTFRRFAAPVTGAVDISPIRMIAGAREINAGQEKDLAKLGAEAIDPLTLRLRLADRQATLLRYLSVAYGVPLHRASLERWGDAWTHPGNLIGNGPYKLESWVPHSEILLVRNPYFQSKTPVSADRIRYLVTDEPETGLKRYLAGEQDWANVPAAKIGWARTERPDEMHSAPALGLRFLFFNVKSGKFAGHPKLREALSLAIDRDVLADKIDKRSELPAYGWLPPVIPDYRPASYDWRAMPMAARLDRARALLAEEGYGPDHPLSVTINYATREDIRRSLLAIGNMWKTGLGVEVTLANEEWRVFIAREEQFDFEIGYLGRSQEIPDAGIFLEPFLSSAGGNSDTGYANPDFDRLLAEANSKEGAARNRTLEQAEAMMLADYPIAPLTFLAVNRLVSPKVKGLHDGAGYPQSRYLSLAP